MSLKKLNSYANRNILGSIAQISAPRCGLVTSFDQATMCAKVALQPDGQTTGWLPVLSQWVGVGWGLVAPLQQNDQVLVLCEGNDAAQGVIVGRYYSDVDTPPQGAAAGEMWLVHQSGSFIKLLADGSISSSGTWNHVGAINATGEITAKAGSAASVTVSGHSHKQPPDSAGNTQEPTDAPTGGT